MSGMGAYEAEHNARLLFALVQQHNARGIGEIHNFFEVGPNWCCPACHRDKQEISRIDKNGNLLCSIHRHHDHFIDVVSDQLAAEKAGLLKGTKEAGAFPRVNFSIYAAHDSICASLIRFPETLICSDCNVAEPVAKRFAQTPPSFSFSPYEIASFINVRSHAPHGVDEDRAKEAFAAAKPSMQLISVRLRAILKSVEEEADNFEHIGGAAWRVLHRLRADVRRFTEEKTED